MEQKSFRVLPAILIAILACLAGVARGQEIQVSSGDPNKLQRSTPGSFYGNSVDDVGFDEGDQKDVAGVLNAVKSALGSALKASKNRDRNCDSTGLAQQLADALKAKLPKGWKVGVGMNYNMVNKTKGEKYALVLMVSPLGNRYMVDVTNEHIEMAAAEELSDPGGPFIAITPKEMSAPGAGRYNDKDKNGKPVGDQARFYPPGANTPTPSGGSCKPPPNPSASKSPQQRQSRDPNDKSGPSGFGAGRFIAPQNPMAYTIEFENKPDATAPAQEVTITDLLPSEQVDLSTFRFGPIAFGDHVALPPAVQNEFSLDVDLRPAKNLIVRVTGKLDPFGGLLTVNFSSIDPATGELTEDPLGGFLPPNTEPPAGEGSISFTVEARKGLDTGTLIKNKATIVFDANPPLDTPEWANTVDISAPKSQVNGLDATQPLATFNVNWGGSDPGAGVQGYSVYVSEDGGPYTLWRERTPDTSGKFTGLNGKAYAFYTVAEDGAGNLESAPAAADATTAVAVTAIRPGDVNQDQVVDIRDAILELQFIVNIASPNAQQQTLGDVNGDGTIDITDVVRILRFIVGLEDSLGG